MTENEYRAVLHDTLKRHTEAALDMIFQIKINLPEKAEAVEFGIHPSQDEDGLFSVMVHLCGPDLYVLNKAIEKYRELFDAKFIEGELQPNVPVFDLEGVSFSVNDVIVGVGVDWINTLWGLSGGLGIPGYAFGEECSTTGSVPLGK